MSSMIESAVSKGNSASKGSSASKDIREHPLAISLGKICLLFDAAFCLSSALYCLSVLPFAA
jgi:hypothetical protein